MLVTKGKQKAFRHVILQIQTQRNRATPPLLPPSKLLAWRLLNAPTGDFPLTQGFSSPLHIPCPVGHRTLPVQEPA